MLSPDDTLLTAAVNWRGKPAEFVNGALGDIGKTFTQAWNDAPWFALTPDSQLAFEFFAGLVFNADYEGTEGLKGVIESWIVVRPPGEWLLSFDIRLPWPEVIPEFIPLSGRRGHPRILESQDYTVGGPLLGPVFFLSSIRPDGTPGNVALELKSGNAVYIIARWDAQNGSWIITYSRNPEWYEWLPSSCWVEPGSIAPLPEFMPDMLARTLSYIGIEKALDREYYSLDNTARTLNDFLFPNWAEGKFGSAVAR